MFSAVMVHDFIQFPYKEIQAERLILVNVSPSTSQATICGRLQVMITNNNILLDHPVYVKAKVKSAVLKKYMLYNIAKKTQFTAMLDPQNEELETKIFNATTY